MEISDLKNWVEAARLRTLPLSLATIIAGGALARRADGFHLGIFVLALLTTTTLQILANFANDYGDFKKGTDSNNRVGPARTLQSGAISPGQMKLAIRIFVLLCAGFGVPLIILGSGSIFGHSGLVFAVLGLIAIGAAMAYTLGEKPYGYAGFGDGFVFAFFGPIGVLGTKFLMTGTLTDWDALVSVAFGFLSVGVLNVNNMRDRENDEASGKRTIPVRVGLLGAKIYHAFLLIGGLGGFLIYALELERPGDFPWLMILGILVLFIAVQQGTLFSKESHEMDPYLKRLSLGSLILSIYLFIWTG